jgi:tryptophan 2,3-dioxygenase
VNRPTNYCDYIRVEELLGLQGGLAPDDAALANEEVLFVVVHQVYELWFKLVLRELTAARDLFTAPVVAEQELSGAVTRMRRIVTILRVAVHHFEVVETLGTREYLAFRDKLFPASGFQSAQLRQIEIMLGLQEDERIPLGPPGSHMKALDDPTGLPSPARARVERQLADRPSLREALEAWLARTPIEGAHHDAPDAGARLQRFVDRFLAAHARHIDAARDHAQSVTTKTDSAERLAAMYEREKASVREFLAPGATAESLRRQRVRAAMLFIETYRDLPLLSWPREILAAVIELEQAFVLFRQRHARMVERVIGRRTGTGGSAGVEYLDQTALVYRVFRDLWAVRTMLLPRELAGLPEGAAFYGFATPPTAAPTRP